MKMRVPKSPEDATVATSALALASEDGGKRAAKSAKRTRTISQVISLH